MNERGAGRPGGGQMTSEEQEWHNKPLQERLQALRSRQNLPSFIDQATIDDRIKWLEKEIAEPGGLGARPKGRRPAGEERPGGGGGGQMGGPGAGQRGGQMGGPGAGQRGQAGAAQRGGAAEQGGPKQMGPGVTSGGGAQGGERSA